MTSKYLTSELALLALRNRLCVPGWQLKAMLQDAVMRPELYVIETYHLNDVPVGVMIAKHSRYQKKSGVLSKASHRRPSACRAVELQAFVRRRCRRQGIGAILFGRMEASLPGRRFRAYEGSLGTGEFWRGVNVKPWYCPSRLGQQDWSYQL